jgi:hypothetical protein
MIYSALNVDTFFTDNGNDLFNISILLAEQHNLKTCSICRKPYKVKIDLLYGAESNFSLKLETYQNKEEQNKIAGLKIGLHKQIEHYKTLIEGINLKAKAKTNEIVNYN